MSEELLNEMNRTLGEIKGTLNGVAENQKDQGERLVAVEGKVNSILGWAAGVGAAGGMVVSWLKERIMPGS